MALALSKLGNAMILEEHGLRRPGQAGRARAETRNPDQASSWKGKTLSASWQLKIK